MVLLVRLVLPGVAHHVTKRGNRRLPVFFGYDDRRAYLHLIAEGPRTSGYRCLARCPIGNHFHLILVPSAAAACALCWARSAGATRYGQGQRRLGELYPSGEDRSKDVIRLREPRAAGSSSRAGVRQAG